MKTIKTNLPAKTSLIIGFVFLAIVSVNCQEITNVKPLKEHGEKNWWSSIVQKHQLKTTQFYCFKGLYETGKSIIKSDSILTIKDAVVICDGNDEYYLIRTPLATHNLKTNIIDIKEGTEEMYSKKSPTGKPVKISKISAYQHNLAQNVLSGCSTEVWRDSTYSFKKLNIKPTRIN
jgi:hypothetical protein